jgi:hypothetical protein
MNVAFQASPVDIFVRGLGVFLEKFQTKPLILLA